jgi:hypothetical protein
MQSSKNPLADKQISNGTEKSKLLSVLHDILKILNTEKTKDEILEQICEIIQAAFNFPKYTSIRIKVDTTAYKNHKFKESPLIAKQSFKYPIQKEGSIEIYYAKHQLNLVESEPLIKNPDFLTSISALVIGVVSKSELEILHYDNTERLKELKGINRTTEILKSGKTLEESLQEICNFLPEAWQYPNDTVARIIYEDKIFKSRNFKETPWMQNQNFDTVNDKKGSIEIYYLKEFSIEYEGPFLKEERNLIDNLAALIAGTASKKALQELLYQNTERLKELKGINATTSILKEYSNLEDSLQIICADLPKAWQYPDWTVARITYEKKVFTSINFKESPWVQRQIFETPGKKKGLIEIFYLKEFPEEAEGPFLQEERNLLINLASLIAGSASKEVLNKLLYENKERLKELKAINLTTALIAEGHSIDKTLQEVCSVLPKSWQYPKYTATRITYEGKTYCSINFKETQWIQKENFITIDNKKGSIEVFYLKEFPHIYEGPFMKEERHLLINLSKLLCGYINDQIGREIYNKSFIKEKSDHKPNEYRKSLIENKQPLQLFFNKQALEKYIYLDMMKYKVKEILFVATLYDAFILENEDSFFERFMGEIYQYSLFSLPRITGVTSPEQTLEVLEKAHFDIVILMVGIDRDGPIELSKKIKQKRPNLPIFLLINHKSNIKHFEDLVPKIKSIDKLFVWNGHSQIFFSIVKSVEDNANAENDTQIGLVRIILLIEDSSQYYSTYFQILYSIVFGQIQQLLPEVERNEIDKICKMRSRPKILHALNYEEALYIFNKYKEFMLCVISDAEFERNGNLDKNAGTRFIKYAKSVITNLPVILQSADISNKKVAEESGIYYIDKNSGNLSNDLKAFLTDHLYFGDFIFRNKEGKQIAVARSLREFETMLHTIPEESIYRHAKENEFSQWLMSRGEIQLARTINPMKIDDFPSLEEARQFFIDALRNYKDEKKKGKILSYDETSILDEKNIVSLSGGSLGGKGRGLAFINALIYNLNFSSFTNEINIRTPITAIIGTDEFDTFLKENNLSDKVFNSSMPYDWIKQLFNNARLSDSLLNKLEVFVNQINKPIVIRSSSLSEDSITQPFAGVFDTYIVPNNDPDNKTTLQKVANAIKLVYASVFSDNARTYFQAINHKPEEEKMAVVLQELVGNQYGDYYYPHFSGTAQSYNFYPVANMKPEEGFAVAAVGLGFYVVGGRKSYRFSPKYPKIETYSTKDLLNSTQIDFLAVDMSQREVDYMKDGEMSSIELLDIDIAEKHGALNHCASVYNRNNDRIEYGLSSPGPRIINFADILKFDYIPLAQTIDSALVTIEEALGSPVEIEYAVDLNRTLNNLPSFYLLQIKPMVGNQLGDSVKLDSIDKTKTILFTHSSLGNGVIDDIKDVIYVDIQNFDKLKTLDMVREIEQLNNTMVKHKRKYLLIGPGRWGTRDQFLGIPVAWSQISNAKVIVEISLANFPLESSLGSHFFHNITSMNIGYFSVLDSSSTDFIRWDSLIEQKLIHQTKYFRHIQFDKPLKILMNGKQKTSAVLKNL